MRTCLCSRHGVDDAMKCLHVEMIGGASGNMLLGAMVDAGLDLNAVERVVSTIPLEPWRYARGRAMRKGIAATLLDVVLSDGRPAEGHRDGGAHLSDVLSKLGASSLSTRQKERCTAIYRRLAQAEAKVHGTSIDHVHFHEVGATDAIVDIASFVVALDVLGVERVFCTVFPVGIGSIVMDHGEYPNPPPATMELLLGCALRQTAVEGEMVTTTAAAILTTLCDSPGTAPSLRPAMVGYGAGHRDASIPNVTRIVVGELLDSSDDAEERGIVLEANIDDMSPQDCALAMERLFEEGAWDVWITPILMKKSRPAITMSVLAPESLAEPIGAAILTNTTTIGYRYYHVEKNAVERRFRTVETPFGSVSIKESIVGGNSRPVPEYEDLARIAREHAMPLWRVRALVFERLFNER